MQIIAGLPTTTVERIVEELRPRLCLDFIKRLPTEVCLRIMSFLDPNSLIQLALASRDAKVLALDWKLWQNLYYLEGWKTVPGEVEAFLKELSSKDNVPEHDRPESDCETNRPSNKKRATPQLVSPNLGRTEDFDREMDGVNFTMPSETSLFGGPIISPPDDIFGISAAPSSRWEGGHVETCPHQNRQSAKDQISRQSQCSRSAPSQLENMATLVTKDMRTGRQIMNWRHLYTQRRKLEANWEAGKFTNFQIPHPQHSYQAHSECIYTIQFQGRYLVSGSRDKSIRIWDMESRHLVLPPLIGHTGSVLCLQFDADPEEDIIVSGSSDASVILWKFSTGRAIQRLKHAHRESVLNVRFDHRILVTCSKDKFIKIFNRKPLAPGDVGYPASHAVAPVPVVLNNYGFNPSPLADAPILKPYTVIGTLEGHNAAVNAVQIWKNEIVSASGDRNVKVWDWPLQTCTRTLIGHNKGIACVQYDGRRIVSGSSDNEVKVFDKDTGLEVASLRAHSQLVRTVQAGFGDLPYSTEEDLAAAKNIDHQYFSAVEEGLVSRSVSLSRSRARNAGSSRPEHIMAYGAKLPPGGGGGQYGRIVSGSYDESVIIWRRDKEGAWKVAHTFKQEEAARAASRNISALRIPESSRSNTGALLNGSLSLTDPFYHHFIDKAVQAGPNPLRQLLHSWPGFLTNPRVKEAIDAEADKGMQAELQKVYNSELNIAASAGRIQTSFLIANMGENTSLAATMGLSVGSSNSVSPTPNEAEAPPQLHSAHGNLPPHAQQLALYLAANGPHTASSHASNDQTIPAANATAAQLGVLNNHLGGYLPNTTNMFGPHNRARDDGGGQARVFKLQYDARRIVACSQTAVIVGWDFACGDEEIIEASRFFAGID